jgi:hypothetical protein
MGRTPPQISLGTIALGANTFQNFPRAHVEKLHVDVLVFSFVASDEVA